MGKLCCQTVNDISARFSLFEVQQTELIKGQNEANKLADELKEKLAFIDYLKRKLENFC